MRTSKKLAVLVLALAITGGATGRQLAMLVEVTPQQAVAGGTLTEIVVPVAPAPSPLPVPDGSVSESEQRQQPAAASAAATAPATESAPFPAPAPAPEPEPVPIESSEVTIQCFSPPSPVFRGRDELTVIVMREGAAVPGLTAEQFAVTAGGEPLPVAYLEGPGEGFANLRIAIDLDEAMSAEMEWISEMVARLAEIVNPRPGINVVRDLIGRFSSPIRFDPSDTNRVGWIDAGSATPQEDLPRLVLSSLENARTRRGKTFLVIVTDGRGPRNVKAWKGVHEVATEAGVPILIAGVWQEGFGSGLRKDLRKLANESGGAVFYVQGATQVNDLVERFGSVVGSAYAVCVESIRVVGTIEVGLVGVDAEVQSATAIRWNKPRYDFEVGRMRGSFVYFADAANFT